jgi:outer membrane protein OmpA-like peptidoglycan-associated protein
MDKYSQDEIWTAYTLAAAEMALRCPSDSANFNPAIHDEACPKFYDLMAFADLAQVCPSDPADYDPARDDAACPKFFDLLDKYPQAQWAVIDLLINRDTDKDNINDFLDVCPERKEDYNGFADSDGCPDGGVVAVVGGEIITYRPVYFAFNRYNIQKEEQQIIDLVVRKINETPWIKRVRIAGNADARGTEAANQKISERRANAVIDYMRSHGVRSNVRLDPVGYGARRPVAPNLTEEQRQRNRRVTFGVEPGRYRPYQPRTSPLPGATSSAQPATPPPPPGPPPPTPSPQPNLPPEPAPLPTPTEDAAEPPALPEEQAPSRVPQRWDET